MRDLFFRILPYAMGLGLGVLIFWPPAFFEALGIWRPAILGLLLVVGILASMGVTLAATLPANPKIERAPGPPPAEVAGLISGLHELGFESVDPPLRVDLRPAAIVWTLAHREFGCWASVFCTGTLPRKVGFDIFTRLAGGTGSITSLSDPNGAVLPAPRGALRQVLPRATPRELLMFHLAAQDFLAGRGARFEAPVLSGIEAKVRRAIAEQRRAVAANPLKAAAVVYWRALTKRNPYMRPLAEQAEAAPALRALGVTNR